IRTLSNESDFTKVKLSFDALFQKSFNNTHNIKDAIEFYKGEKQVKLMTVHKSKGLEFDTVFFVDFNADAWWGLGNAVRGNDLARVKEEQNTFFVGASRAKEKLIFTNGQKGQWPPAITTILNESDMIWQFIPQNKKNF
ncbi:MAG: ATP-binding domain-containing protein, partial [Crenarchaeota archaeon]|nr:ATP-binding domain-containing protein [Thermoproteota archaeon]